MSNQSVAREVLQRLLSPDERIAMNLFELILESENPCLHTDRKSCILLQSNPQTPLWAWFAPSMDAESVESAAQFLAERIRAEVPVGEVIINPVGPVIGAHTGPGVMALFHVGTHR